ncbi:MAG: hypothetical protein DUD39_17495 [Coriobacteriaceae bacterium]|nr:MAG: hypothetical protein DUD39_17495 [Coriobacteriaceae bacterium]
MLADNGSGQQLPPKAARDLATFRKSVNDEMVYQRNVGGRSYRIVNGERIRREKTASIYSFEMESELHLSEDAPITVDVDKRSSKGSVIACEAFEITLSLEEDLGEKVPLAYIHAEPWKLLEALNERLSTLNAAKWLRTSGITAGIPVAAPLHHMDERLMHPEERRKQWRRAMQAD